MRLLRILLIHLFLAGCFTLSGQEEFYNPTRIHEIRIVFPQDNWRHILDSLFINLGDQGRLEGVVTIDGKSYAKTGIRYKGYSSYNANEIKNPFNIDLDYRIRNQNHLGYVKLKLSNVIQDPSFVREVLAYEIARKYLPASSAGFARLFVNDTLIGLYTNVEAVDMKFIKSRFGGDENTFFKGEPETLEYPFGQNANLALVHGDDSLNYVPYYNMESLYGWSDLLEMIRLLDQGAGNVEPMLNIDRALWMHAFNEVILNLDSYIGYCQNYYMYRDDDGRFNPIPWDLNMAFGSFRESDGSTNFQGITIPKLKVLDPLALMNFAITPRPLMTKLFANDTLRKTYLAHMRTLVDENIRNGWYFSRAAELQAQIDADVKADSNKFYSYQNFLDNLTVTVGGTGGMKAYPGLKELMEARMNYLDTYPGFHGEPVISQTAYEPGIPAAGEPCWITARINGAPRAYLGYRFKPDGPFSKTTLFDDGLHHDGTAGDGIFGAMILPEGNLVRYYYYAENDSAAALLPERAEYEFFTIKLKIKKGDVVINEVTGSQNGVGWIEIFNTTGENLSVAGMRLSFDVVSSVGHFLPDTIIPPKSYLTMNATLFSDDPESQTRWNTSLSGGAILLFNSSGDQVDSVSYGYLTDGKSSGRWPNGYGTLTYMTPTRGKYNTMGSTPSSGFNLFPNPARDVIFIEFKAGAEPVTYKMFTTSGQLAGQGGESPVMGGTSRILPVPISGLRAGLYFLQLDNQGIKTTKKFIVY